MDFGSHCKTLPVLLTVAEQFQPHKKGFGGTKCKTFVSRSSLARRIKSLPAEGHRHKKRRAFMKIKILFVTFLTLALFTPGDAQRLDKAKLDQFFDRLAE